MVQASHKLINKFTRWSRSVEGDFQGQECRINRHRVDLDNLGDRADLLEEQIASLSVAESRGAVEVVDLTLESDEEETPEDRAEDLPALEGVSPITGSSQGDGLVSRQLCIRTLGRINKPEPYPVPLGSRREGAGVPRRRDLCLGVAREG